MYIYYWHLLGYIDQGRVNAPCFHLCVPSWLPIKTLWFSLAAKKQTTWKQVTLRHHVPKTKYQIHRWVLKWHPQTSQTNQHGFNIPFLWLMGGVQRALPLWALVQTLQCASCVHIYLFQQIMRSQSISHLKCYLRVWHVADPQEMSCRRELTHPRINGIQGLRSLLSPSLRSLIMIFLCTYF